MKSFYWMCTNRDWFRWLGNKTSHCKLFMRLTHKTGGLIKIVIVQILLPIQLVKEFLCQHLLGQLVADAFAFTIGIIIATLNVIVLVGAVDLLRHVFVNCEHALMTRVKVFYTRLVGLLIFLW